MVGRLEMYVGSMFAEKSTHLIRQGKRHMLAGRKVVFLKPSIDGRYSDNAVVTHDGEKIEAINIRTTYGCREDVKTITENTDVVCIDEVQFFNFHMVMAIEELLIKGIHVYVAGLDMDRFGQPFGIVPHLMAVAEKVTKVHAVCGYCGEDAWRTLGTENLKNNNQINIGNDYVPACRNCVEVQGGGMKSEFKRTIGRTD